MAKKTILPIHAGGTIASTQSEDGFKPGLTFESLLAKTAHEQEYFNRLLFMDEGRIVEEGKPAEVMKNPKSERLQDFLAHVKHH